MAWTAPATQTTGDLITADIYNKFINNIAYLKGLAGDVIFEDDIIPNTTQKVGLAATPWAEGHFTQLFVGPQKFHKAIREIIIPFESDAWGTYQLADGLAGGGAISMGGVGQVVLKVDDDIVGSAYFYGRTEQASSQNTAFNVARNPYIRMEFAINNSDPATQTFLGFRQTPGAAKPLPAAEKYAGFQWTGAIWVFQNGDGAGNSDTSAPQTINANTRYVIEIYIESATKVDYYLDGTLIKSSTTALPTGDLEWGGLIVSDASGGVGDDSLLTEGQIIVQEELS